MKNPRAESSVEGWISVADLYAKHIDHATGNYAEHALKLLPISKDMKILDMATGSGALAIRVAKRGAEVTAIDFTPPLIKILTDRANKENLDNLEALVMNGQNLDFEDNIFDAAFSVFGLMLFSDRNKGFSELKRVLIPEGKAIVVTWDAPPNNEWFATFQEAVRTALPEMPTPDPPPFLEVADKKTRSRDVQCRIPRCRS